MMPAFGFRELAHTADWELEAWAPDLPGLLEQAVRGMDALAGIQLRAGSPQERRLVVEGLDAESLLVRFLSEVLWLEQDQGLGFDRFSIQIDERFRLQAELRGHPIAHLNKEIKAVTYHNLQVERTLGKLRVKIVFDV